ncbi:MAG: hypothetical protein UEE32_00950, partial [Oscillospiraceae bacterium]|nr:hypothetical protein [Oscillospiraceae bacterium]
HVILHNWLGMWYGYGINKKLGGRVSIPRFRRRVHLYNRRTGRYFWSVLLFSGGQESHSEPSSIAAAGFVFVVLGEREE